MSLMGKLAPIVASAGLLASAGNVNGQGVLYDNFSSGSLNSSLWRVMQDTEGQPLMDEYGVSNENGNNVFHTQQNSIADRRVYLLPNKVFTTGDTIGYDLDTRSHEGNYGGMVLLTGDQYIRIGINGFNGGVQGFDEIGIAHISFTFNQNSLDITRQSPSETILRDSLALSKPNGNYSLQIGSFTGHNGMAHMDYDNFFVGQIPEPTTTLLFLGGLGALALNGMRKKE